MKTKAKNKNLKRVVVFCGSSMGTNPIFKEDAISLGKALVNQGIGLVYGGANIGLMGAVADSVLANGGEVIGILPKFLSDKEIAHTGLTELIIVDTMHERKAKMNELCDGAIALAGGFGTLEELIEMLTWGQLGLHKKPIGILNTNNFYAHLFYLLEEMVQKGFLNELNRNMLIESRQVNDLLHKMQHYKAHQFDKLSNEI